MSVHIRLSPNGFRLTPSPLRALAAAKLLKAREAELPGTVVLLFQPAEEGPGGAAVMIGVHALPAMTNWRTVICRFGARGVAQWQLPLSCFAALDYVGPSASTIAAVPSDVSLSDTSSASHVEEGVLDGVIAAHGLHVWPVAPAGVITSRVSPADAAGQISVAQGHNLSR